MDRRELKLLINESSEGVSVTWWGHGLDGATGFSYRGVAEATNMGDEWQINRVLVQGEGTRGHGIGGHMLEALKEAVVRQGGQSLWVQPGGYGSDPASQNRFYEAHGFVGRGERGFEWKPDRQWLKERA